MGQRVEFSLKDGGTILVEVHETGPPPAGRSPGAPAVTR